MSFSTLACSLLAMEFMKRFVRSEARRPIKKYSPGRRRRRCQHMQMRSSHDKKHPFQALITPFKKSGLVVACVRVPNISFYVYNSRSVWMCVNQSLCGMEIFLARHNIFIFVCWGSGLAQKFKPIPLFTRDFSLSYIRKVSKETQNFPRMKKAWILHVWFCFIFTLYFWDFPSQDFLAYCVLFISFLARGEYFTFMCTSYVPRDMMKIYVLGAYVLRVQRLALYSLFLIMKLFNYKLRNVRYAVIRATAKVLLSNL